MFQTDQQYITKEMEALRQSEREAWRYADELEQERKQLQAMLNQERTENEALLREALEALRYFDDYIQPLTDKFGGPKVAEPASTSWHVHKAIAAIKERLK